MLLKYIDDSKFAKPPNLLFAILTVGGYRTSQGRRLCWLAVLVKLVVAMLAKFQATLIRISNAG